jgi:hypothetical protein
MTDPSGSPERSPARSHEQLLGLLSRRQVLARASATALGALVASALPLAYETSPARAATKWTNATAGAASEVSLADATMQAFSDTIIPGRTVAVTESGQPIAPLAIAGVDPLPGAVEADALALYHNAEVGFDALEPAFLADIEARSLEYGGQFLDLSFADRVKVCLAGLDFSNTTYLIWEAASAVPFTAFCAAALVIDATWNDAVGYRVMGLPGIAPNGYQSYSWRRRLSTERTRTGSLP